MKSFYRLIISYEYKNNFFKWKKQEKMVKNSAKDLVFFSLFGIIN